MGRSASGTHSTRSDAVRNGLERTTQHPRISDKALERHLRQFSLASVAWVVPDDNNTDHPAVTYDFTRPVVGCQHRQCNRRDPRTGTITAIIVVWDDWGGFYDNETPPFFDHWGGVGFRVPMLIISPYAKEGKKRHGYISHTQYEFGSILKFIENVWGSSGSWERRIRAPRVWLDSFDFTQKPRKFTPIGSKYSTRPFLASETLVSTRRQRVRLIAAARLCPRRRSQISMPDFP